MSIHLNRLVDYNNRGLMNEPKSNYVKNRIKGLEFTKKNREYVRILLNLERWALEGPGGWSDAMHKHSVVSDHEKDYLAILKELDPKQYVDHLKEKKEMEDEDRKAEEWKKKEEKAELERED